MKPLTLGTWSLHSPSDSRWNCSGEGNVGGFVLPFNAEVALEQKKKELNEEPPKDLEYIYAKY